MCKFQIEKSEQNKSTPAWKWPFCYSESLLQIWQQVTLVSLLSAALSSSSLHQTSILRAGSTIQSPLADSKLWVALFSTLISINLASALQVPQRRGQAWKEKSSRPTLLLLLFMLLWVQRLFEGMLNTLQGVSLYPITQRNVQIWACGQKIS